MIHDIWMADTRKSAEQALDRFCDTCEAKYPRGDPPQAAHSRGMHSLDAPRVPVGLAPNSLDRRHSCRQSRCGVFGCHFWENFSCLPCAGMIWNFRLI